MKKCKILILDESTSALDAEMEKSVRYNIDKIRKERGLTEIFIAHRLSTVKESWLYNSNMKGRIVEKGTHNELISLNGDYKQLIDKQLVN